MRLTPVSSQNKQYIDLRESVSALKDLQGETSTTEIIKQLDTFYRSLLRVKLRFCKSLINQGKIEKPSDIPMDEFLTAFLRIHNPKGKTTVCSHCYCEIEFTLSVCPYCSGNISMESKRDVLKSAVIDFDIVDKAPNWDIDNSTSDMLKNVPEIKPITKRDDIKGPKGNVGRHEEKKSHKKQSGRYTDRLRRYIRKKELIKLLPFDQFSIQDVIRQDLWAIITCLEGFNNDEILTWSNERMKNHILSKQHGKIDVGPTPQLGANK